MILKHLSLSNLRLFSWLDEDLPAGLLLLEGENAQGKTSLLEAIHYLATLSSFRASSDRQLINLLAVQSRESVAVARLVADYVRDERSHHMEVRLIIEPNGSPDGRFRREVLLDGVRRSTQEALGNFLAVLFSPAMTQIIEGEPEARRHYLDGIISQASRPYSQALGVYQQVLSQRNALLKRLAEGDGEAGELAYWDEMLGEQGALLIQERIRAIQELEALARRVYYELSAEQEVLRLVYQPAYDPLPMPAGQFTLRLSDPIDRSGLSYDDIRQGFQRRLGALRAEEIRRGMTTTGPHRDELRLLSNGTDLGIYGSRGQIRLALLALKLAEVGWLKERTGSWPILLLDEALAELDEPHRRQLLRHVAGYEQAILTSAEPDGDRDEALRGAVRWHIAQGKIGTATLS
jgi:DNA replication and repair protein RecF